MTELTTDQVSHSWLFWAFVIASLWLVGMLSALLFNRGAHPYNPNDPRTKHAPPQD